MSDARDASVSWWLGLAISLVLAACGSTTNPTQIGSETNWLRACERDSDCAASACVCGVCSSRCSDDTDCADGQRCEREASALYSQTCGVDPQVRGLCAPECEERTDCGEGLSCVAGACAPPASEVTADAGTAGLLAGPREPTGPRQLVIDAHLELSSECAPDLERPIGSGVGVFDIGIDAGGECAVPYRLNLRVRNLLTERVLVSQVDVLLMNVQSQPLLFDDDDVFLPNPFSLSVSGSIAAAIDSEPGSDAIVAEAVPSAYAPYLSDFDEDQITVRVQLSGETLNGEPVRSNVFDYRVSICTGCLSMCASRFDSAVVQEMLSESCVAGRAADGWICLDPGC
jgi:hypothetical protein